MHFFHVRAREERACCTCFMRVDILRMICYWGVFDLNSVRFENFCSFGFTMLYAYHLNLKCLPDTVVKEVNEQMDLLVQQDVASKMAYQRIALSLAAGNLNAGRELVIQLFSESVKEHLVKKNAG